MTDRAPTSTFEQIVTALCPGYAPDTRTRDRGKVRLCATSTKSIGTKADLLAALELLLPFAVTAPAWAVEAAQDAIRAAKEGGA